MLDSSSFTNSEAASRPPIPTPEVEDNNAQLVEQQRDLQTLAQLESRFMASGLASSSEGLSNKAIPSSLWSRVKPALAVQAGMKTATAEVDGLALDYWDGGQKNKPVIVLIHGFSASKENWALITRSLLANYRVLAPDVFGFGNSDFDASQDWSLAKQAERLTKWLEQMGVSSAYLVGNSMGGAIAALISATNPAMVSGLCLMNAAGVPSARLSMLEVGILGGENFLVPSSRSEALRLFSIAVNQSNKWLGRGFGLLLAGDLMLRRARHQYLFTEMVKSLKSVYLSLDTIQAETLVLWGDSDQVLDCSSVDVFKARIDNANVFVMPQLGHLPMLEAPKDTAGIIKAFAASALAHNRWVLAMRRLQQLRQQHQLQRQWLSLNFSEGF